MDQTIHALYKVQNLIRLTLPEKQVHEVRDSIRYLTLPKNG